MKKPLSVFLNFLVLSAAIALIGCGARAPKEQVIKIGAIVELTGDMPAVGASSRNAAELAVAALNRAGGITIAGKQYRVVLVTEDNGAKPDQSAAVANKLITQDEVIAIVGPNASLGAIPAAEIAEANRTLLITPWSTNPKTTMNTANGAPKQYVFRACFTDPFEGRVLAGFITGQLGAKRAAVLYDVASEAPKSQAELFRQTFEKLGGSVVAFAIWNSALRHWPVSRVYLFNNLIPLMSTAWACWCLGERLTATFWPAMILIGAGVFLGQPYWEKFFARRWLPTE